MRTIRMISGNTASGSKPGSTARRQDMPSPSTISTVTAASDVEVGTHLAALDRAAAA